MNSPFRLPLAVPCLLATLSLAGSPQSVLADTGGAAYPDALFKDSKNFVDITRAPYNAPNDGKTDVTAIVNRAINDIIGQPLQRKTIYFPPGVYLVSDTLDWLKTSPAGKVTPFARLAFMGAGRDRTTIQLADGAPGFGDATHARPVIKTESIRGTGNDAYNDSIWDLTVNVGKGNPGAVGISWLASNEGSLRRLRIVSPESASGLAGVQMIRAYPGPCYIKDLEVDGFTRGIEVGHIEYIITMEKLVLKGQSSFGILNHGNNLAIRQLVSQNHVPALRNENGFVVVLDSNLTGGDPGAAAIENTGTFLVRQLTTTGYGNAIKSTPSGGTPSTMPGGTITEDASSPVPNPFGGPARTLNLPVKETPEFTDDPATWVNVQDFGAAIGSDADQSPAFQKAIDFAAQNGRTTVYFPSGQYFCDTSIMIHGGVRRLLGLGSVIRVRKAGDFADPAHPSPLFVIKGTTGESIALDSFLIHDYFTAHGSFYDIRHEAATPLVLTNMELESNTGFPAYQGDPGCGDLFIENCVGGSWVFNNPGQKIWARQFDVELNGPHVVNNGCSLWVLGFKTERPGIQIDTTNGATEVLGGELYAVRPAGDPPAFKLTDSQGSFSYVTTAYGNVVGDYENQITETRGGVTKTVTRDNLPRLGLGSIVGLYASVH